MVTICITQYSRKKIYNFVIIYPKLAIYNLVITCLDNVML